MKQQTGIACGLVWMLTLAAEPTGTNSPAKTERPFRIFDGQPKRVHLVSNSRGGGKELQAYMWFRNGVDMAVRSG